MDEIRQYCAQLFSGSPLSRDAAYSWLTQCAPFIKLAETLRKHQFTLQQVAKLVEPDATGPMTDLAVELLVRLVAEHGDCASGTQE